MNNNSLHHDDVIFEDNFESGFENWWVEGSDKVSVENGRLYINADDELYGFSCSVWCMKRIDNESFKIEFDAYVLGSGQQKNNINFFLNYSSPDGRDLYDTRMERSDGSYVKYHNMNGYIFTYVNDIAGERDFVDGVPLGRFRFRKCPGFVLIDQSYDLDGSSGVLRHIEIVKRGSQFVYSVNGKRVLESSDPEPFNSGYFGFRTYMTNLWIDNLKIVEIGD